jgi:hypothetical protein
VRYIDPSGHGVDCGLGESCVIDPYTSPLIGNFNSSSGGGSISSGGGGNGNSGSSGGGGGEGNSSLPGAGGPNCPANQPNCGFGLEACGQGGMTNCPPQQIQDFDLSSVPQSAVLHPLQGNTVTRIPIYDYSYRPPKLIGYRIVSYAYDNVYLNPLGLLPSSSTSNHVSTVNITYRTIDFTSHFIQKQAAEVLKLLVKPFARDMAVAPLCPACSLALRTASAIDIANRVTFIESHLRVHDVYFETPMLLDGPQFQLTVP